MRFKLWAYKQDAFTMLAVEDCESDNWLIRDQSIYAQDKGCLVWKKASHPISVARQASKGILVAQAITMTAFDAEMTTGYVSHLLVK